MIRYLSLSLYPCISIYTYIDSPRPQAGHVPGTEAIGEQHPLSAIKNDVFLFGSDLSAMVGVQRLDQ